MSAQQIAQVIADLDASRVRSALSGYDGLFEAAAANARDGVVVDATAIYRELVAADKPVWIYEDHPCIAPPWAAARICYLNEHGNVIVMAATVSDHDGGQEWETPHPVDWSQVRWVINTTVWVGGRSSTRGPFPTVGPLLLWRFAVGGDGQPADLHWVHLQPAYPMQHWDMAQLVLLGTLNFCACSNVVLAEPARPRAERRRLERTGVRVHTVTILPRGRRRGDAGSSPVGGVPLHSVRGHFATYGGERGLLFGKYAGRFWIPAHARGSLQDGIVEKDYRIVVQERKGTP